MQTKLNESEIRETLKNLPGWQLESGELVQKLKFKDFKEAMAYVMRVALFAEAADHHPDILVRYNQVTLKLSTHSAGGITDKDFSLAKSLTP